MYIQYDKNIQATHATAVHSPAKLRIKAVKRAVTPSQNQQQAKKKQAPARGDFNEKSSYIIMSENNNNSYQVATQENKNNSGSSREASLTQDEVQNILRENQNLKNTVQMLQGMVHESKSVATPMKRFENTGEVNSFLDEANPTSQVNKYTQPSDPNYQHFQSSVKAVKHSYENENANLDYFSQQKQQQQQHIMMSPLDSQYSKRSYNYVPAVYSQESFRRMETSQRGTKNDGPTKVSHEIDLNYYSHSFNKFYVQKQLQQLPSSETKIPVTFPSAKNRSSSHYNQQRPQASVFSEFNSNLPTFAFDNRYDSQENQKQNNNELTNTKESLKQKADSIKDAYTRISLPLSHSYQAPSETNIGQLKNLDQQEGCSQVEDCSNISLLSEEDNGSNLCPNLQPLCESETAIQKQTSFQQSSSRKSAQGVPVAPYQPKSPFEKFVAYQPQSEICISTFEKEEKSVRNFQPKKLEFYPIPTVELSTHRNNNNVSQSSDPQLSSCGSQEEEKSEENCESARSSANQDQSQVLLEGGEEFNRTINFKMNQTGLFDQESSAVKKGQDQRSNDYFERESYESLESPSAESSSPSSQASQTPANEDQQKNNVDVSSFLSDDEEEPNEEIGQLQDVNSQWALQAERLKDTSKLSYGANSCSNSQNSSALINRTQFYSAGDMTPDRARASQVEFKSAKSLEQTPIQMEEQSQIFNQNSPRGDANNCSMMDYDLLFCDKSQVQLKINNNGHNQGGNISVIENKTVLVENNDCTFQSLHNDQTTMIKDVSGLVIVEEQLPISQINLEKSILELQQKIQETQDKMGQLKNAQVQEDQNCENKNEERLNDNEQYLTTSQPTQNDISEGSICNDKLIEMPNNQQQHFQQHLDHNEKNEVVTSGQISSRVIIQEFSSRKQRSLSHYSSSKVFSPQVAVIQTEATQSPQIESEQDQSLKQQRSPAVQKISQPLVYSKPQHGKTNSTIFSGLKNEQIQFEMPEFNQDNQHKDLSQEDQSVKTASLPVLQAPIVFTSKVNQDISICHPELQQVQDIVGENSNDLEDERIVRVNESYDVPKPKGCSSSDDTIVIQKSAINQQKTAKRHSNITYGVKQQKQSQKMKIKYSELSVRKNIVEYSNSQETARINTESSQWSNVHVDDEMPEQPQQPILPYKQESLFEAIDASSQFEKSQPLCDLQITLDCDQDKQQQMQQKHKNLNNDGSILDISAVQQNENNNVSFCQEINLSAQQIDYKMTLGNEDNSKTRGIFDNNEGMSDSQSKSAAESAYHILNSQPDEESDNQESYGRQLNNKNSTSSLNTPVVQHLQDTNGSYVLVNAAYNGSEFPGQFGIKPYIKTSSNQINASLDREPYLDDEQLFQGGFASQSQFSDDGLDHQKIYEESRQVAYFGGSSERQLIGSSSASQLQQQDDFSITYQQQPIQCLNQTQDRGVNAYEDNHVMDIQNDQSNYYYGQDNQVLDQNMAHSKALARPVFNQARVNNHVTQAELMNMSPMKQRLAFMTDIIREDVSAEEQESSLQTTQQLKFDNQSSTPAFNFDYSRFSSAVEVSSSSPMATLNHESSFKSSSSNTTPYVDANSTQQKVIATQKNLLNTNCESPWRIALKEKAMTQKSYQSEEAEDQLEIVVTTEDVSCPVGAASTKSAKSPICVISPSNVILSSQQAKLQPNQYDKFLLDRVQRKLNNKNIVSSYMSNSKASLQSSKDQIVSSDSLKQGPQCTYFNTVKQDDYQNQAQKFTHSQVNQNQPVKLIQYKHQGTPKPFIQSNKISTSQTLAVNSLLTSPTSERAHLQQKTKLDESLIKVQTQRYSSGRNSHRVSDIGTSSQAASSSSKNQASQISNRSYKQASSNSQRQPKIEQRGKSVRGSSCTKKVEEKKCQNVVQLKKQINFIEKQAELESKMKEKQERIERIAQQKKAEKSRRSLVRQQVEREKSLVNASSSVTSLNYANDTTVEGSKIITPSGNCTALGISLNTTCNGDKSNRSMLMGTNDGEETIDSNDSRQLVVQYKGGQNQAPKRNTFCIQLKKVRQMGQQLNQQSNNERLHRTIEHSAGGPERNDFSSISVEKVAQNGVGRNGAQVSASVSNFDNSNFYTARTSIDGAETSSFGLDQLSNIKIQPQKSQLRQPFKIQRQHINMAATGASKPNLSGTPSQQHQQSKQNSFIQKLEEQRNQRRRESHGQQSVGRKVIINSKQT